MSRRQEAALVFTVKLDSAYRGRASEITDQTPEAVVSVDGACNWDEGGAGEPSWSRRTALRPGVRSAGRRINECLRISVPDKHRSILRQ
ncbi:hypothetical protein GQ53DRAFT_63752 [Thozetella sp. PMI_491]|nr:hypothetical protein GQ53DRAFT_63752 [Thozetella sp. PMI_491]